MNKILITPEEKNNILKMLPFNNVCEAMLSLPYKQGTIIELENGDMVKINGLSPLIRAYRCECENIMSGYYLDGNICIYSNTISDFIVSYCRIIFDINTIKYVIIK